MAAQAKKERKDPQATPAAAGNNAKNTEGTPAEGKDPDLYDPVGMAGKKAGIVEEIGQQLEQEASDPPTEPGSTGTKKEQGRGGQAS